MPAVYAHYLFGKKVYKALPEAEKKMVRQGKDAFLIGLHGPDLLFYYRPFGKNRINQQGTRMHRELAAGFFEKGKEEYEKDHDPVLRAYPVSFYTGQRMPSIYQLLHGRAWSWPSGDRDRF